LTSVAGQNITPIQEAQMSLSSALFPSGLLWFAVLPALLAIFMAVRAAPWQSLIEDKALQHRYLAVTVILVIVWRINIDLNFDVVIHFLGLTTVTLLFGWPLAILSAAAAQLGFLFSGLDEAASLALNFLVSGVFPIAVTWWIHQWIEARKPINPFMFIMGTGFLSCLISSTLVSALAIGLLYLGGVYEFTISISEYFGYLPLFIFPEAVVNGMFISAITILHPSMVVTFDEERYFKQDEHRMILDEEIPDSLDVEKHETQSERDEQGNFIEDKDAPYRPPEEWYQDKDKDR
jgi:uncharacterized membrane protein